MSKGRDHAGEKVVGVETLSQNIHQTLCQEEADVLKELKGFEEKGWGGRWNKMGKQGTTA